MESQRNAALTAVIARTVSVLPTSTAESRSDVRDVVRSVARSEVIRVTNPDAMSDHTTKIVAGLFVVVAQAGLPAKED